MKHGKGAVKFLQKGDEYEGEWVSDRYCRCERARCCTRARADVRADTHAPEPTAPRTRTPDAGRTARALHVGSTRSGRLHL